MKDEKSPLPNSTYLRLKEASTPARSVRFERHHPCGPWDRTWRRGSILHIYPEQALFPCLQSIEDNPTGQSRLCCNSSRQTVCPCDGLIRGPIVSCHLKREGTVKPSRLLPPGKRTVHPYIHLSRKCEMKRDSSVLANIDPFLPLTPTPR